MSRGHSTRVAFLHLVRRTDAHTGEVRWSVRYRDRAGRSVALQLGRQPVISPEQAAKLSGDCRFEHHRVIVPARGTGLRPRRSDTVATIVDRYIERHGKPNSKSWSHTKALLDRDVLPVWRNRYPASITRQDVHALVDSIIDRGAPVMAERVLKAIQAVWNWNLDRGYVDASPFLGIRSPIRRVPRERVLTDAELAAIWRALDGFRWRFSGAIRLLMLTGQRRTEVLAARWSEFDLSARVWSVPRERRKKGVATHDVPLSDDAVAILRHLPRVPSSPYLFPATRGTGFYWNNSLAKARLERISGAKGWVIHDFRRTLATRLQELGYRLEVIEDVLGHVSGSRKGVVGVYQRHRFKDQKRDALEAWAQYLRHVFGPGRPTRRFALVFPSAR
jgi:integrase